MVFLCCVCWLAVIFAVTFPPQCLMSFFGDHYYDATQLRTFIAVEEYSIGLACALRKVIAFAHLKLAGSSLLLGGAWLESRHSVNGMTVR